MSAASPLRLILAIVGLTSLGIAADGPASVSLHKQVATYSEQPTLGAAFTVQDWSLPM